MNLYAQFSRQTRQNWVLYSLLLYCVGAGSSVLASKSDDWSVLVNVYNPACTGGDERCWRDKRNSRAALEVADYLPLRLEEVNRKHHICVSFPHMKDSYFAGVAYGIISEARRLGQKITLLEAGGYTNLEKQLNQVEDCIANGAEALVIAPISRRGNAKQIDVIRAAGVPVVVIITGVNTTIDAYSLQSFYHMGFVSCQWVVEQHETNSKIRAAWFPGPPGAGWSVAGNQGCLDAMRDTSVEIVSTHWGDTGKAIQLELVENLLQAMSFGEQPEVDYIIGTATTIEGAVGAVRARGLQQQVKLVSYYYTPGLHIFLKRGAVAMAPSDKMIAQARMAIDQTVRLLENKSMATGGRAEYGRSGRITEHIEPQLIIVTPNNVEQFDTGSTLAPEGWRPKFSVD